ncbi:MAG: hypothetical protein K2F97_01925 [Muribaculaceae bacterium]|nr:hypothetical protein [Muribaculaceae bacterium]MDE6487136.1 hypothetical protein [Muribaculaceae bacterium]
MKHLLLVILLAFLPSINVLGAENSSNSIKLRLSPKPGRHQLPVSVSIDCTYFNDVMNFGFHEDVEWAIVDIKDGEGWLVASEVVYAADPALEVSLTEGEYEITCRTDGNQIFSGAIYIQ